MKLWKLKKTVNSQTLEETQQTWIDELKMEPL
jgi:hypothetical protein